MTDIIVTRDLRYQYSEHEHVRLAEDLSHEIMSRDAALKLFDKAKAAHKEAVERLDSSIRDLSRKLTEGWEIRDVPCRLLPNDPEPGRRTIMRIDTGEVVAVEDMHTGETIEAPPVDKLFETTLEKVVEQVNAGALNKDGVTCTATLGGSFDEASVEEKSRTRKAAATRKKLLGQDAILPDHRKPKDEPLPPGAPA